jgi:hypothetical protein
LEPGETKALPNADDIHFRRNNHKYVVSYAGVSGNENNAESVLAIQAVNKTFDLVFN